MACRWTRHEIVTFVPVKREQKAVRRHREPRTKSGMDDGGAAEAISGTERGEAPCNDPPAADFPPESPPPSIPDEDVEWWNNPVPRDTPNFYDWRDLFPELQALIDAMPEIYAECGQVAAWTNWPETASEEYDEGENEDWKVYLPRDIGVTSHTSTGSISVQHF